MHTLAGDGADAELGEGVGAVLVRYNQCRSTPCRFDNNIPEDIPVEIIPGFSAKCVEVLAVVQ